MPLILANRYTLSQHGLSVADMAAMMIRLDQETMPMLSPSEIGNANQWAPLLETPFSLWGAVLNEKHLLGYFHFLLPNPTAISDLISGGLKEGELTTAHLNSDLVGTHDLYLTQITLLRNSQSFPMMVADLSEQVYKHAQQSTFFNTIWLRVCSAAGLRFSNRLGFKEYPLDTSRLMARNAPMLELLNRLSAPRYLEISKLYLANRGCP